MSEIPGLLELAARRPLTIDDLPPEGVTGRYELIDGSLHVSPLADVPHQMLVARFTVALTAAAPAGSIVLPGVNVIVGTGTIVSPDVAVIDPGRTVRGGLGVAPAGLLLAIEISSASTRRQDLTVKRDLYREWGVPYVFVDRRPDPHTLLHEGPMPAWAQALADLL